MITITDFDDGDDNGLRERVLELLDCYEYGDDAEDAAEEIAEDLDVEVAAVDDILATSGEAQKLLRPYANLPNASEHEVTEVETDPSEHGDGNDEDKIF